MNNFTRNQIAVHNTASEYTSCTISFTTNDNEWNEDVLDDTTLTEVINQFDRSLRQTRKWSIERLVIRADRYKGKFALHVGATFGDVKEFQQDWVDHLTEYARKIFGSIELVGEPIRGYMVTNAEE